MAYYQIIYYAVLLLITLSGFYVFHKNREALEQTVIQMKKNRFVQIQDLIRNSVDNIKINSLFKQSGVSISAYQYQLIRYTIMCVWLVLILISILKGGIKNHIFLWMALFLVSSPRTHFLSWRTPFKVCLDVLIDGYRAKQNKEIYRAILQLKNMAITKHKKPLGAVFILEQLRKFTKTTRPIFNQMLSLWTLGRIDEACEYFKQAIPTDESAKIASLFNKLDSIHPNELQGQLALFQDMIKDSRKTEKMRFNQRRSYILTAVISLTLVLGLLNFTIVVYFIDFLKTTKTF